MTLLHVDVESWTPPYEQLRTQIAGQVASGELPAGHRLPPVRRLAADLDLAPNTVARAYRELERAGVLETRGRRGTFVLAAVPEDLEVIVDDFARRVVAAGLDPERALALAAAALGNPVVPSDLSSGR